MPKISRQSSVHLSMALSALFLLSLAACAVALPFLRDRLSGSVLEPLWPYLLITLYAMLIVAAIADVLLLRLLLRVKRRLVFTPESVSLIRAVSWCCFALAALSAQAGFWLSFLLFALALAAALLGLCLRVVKNVIEEATAIKAENDLTV